jgi:polygalacturonase
MIRPVKIYALLLSLISFGCNQELPKVLIQKTIVDAPFGETTIQAPDFQNCPEFSIVDFGAEIGNKEKTSKAIRQAIAKANESGCGTVVIPSGEWLTGKIHFKSNVNLYLQEGATLLFSDDRNDYLPAVKTTWEGIECYNYSPLIYAYECENVAITGKGELKAILANWEPWMRRPAPHMNSLKRLYTLMSEGSSVEDRIMVNDTSNLRPHFIQFNRSKRILLDGISITNSPFWTIHPFMSQNVTIRNLNVYAHRHNNDGVDPEMSQNMLIENCVFDQGDDAIAVKAGRNQDAWRLDTPSKNIIVRNCLVKNGHQLIAIGSELSGGIENVWVDNCTVDSVSNLYNLVFIKTNERRGGFVKNIYVSNIEAGDTRTRNGVLGIETDVLYQWRHLVPTYERRLTPISNVFLTNVNAGEVEYITKIEGQEEEPIKNVKLINVSVKKVRGDEERLNKNIEGYMESESE